MIKNYIFDFGNVLAQFNPDRITQAHIDDKNAQKIIKELVFSDTYWRALDEGSVTDDEFKALLCNRTPDELKEAACTVFDNWIATMTPVQGMQKLIFDIQKTDKRLYLLSNISIGFAENYNKVDWIKELLDCFDGLMFSGVVKK